MGNDIIKLSGLYRKYEKITNSIKLYKMNNDEYLVTPKLLQEQEEFEKEIKRLEDELGLAEELMFQTCTSKFQGVMKDTYVKILKVEFIPLQKIIVWGIIKNVHAYTGLDFTGIIYWGKHTFYKFNALVGDMYDHNGVVEGKHVILYIINDAEKLANKHIKREEIEYESK
jgi:hypothetical protein